MILPHYDPQRNISMSSLLMTSWCLQRLHFILCVIVYNKTSYDQEFMSTITATIGIQSTVQ